MTGVQTCALPISIFSKLMGDEVSLRKSFIQTRAKDANFDELDV